MYKSTLPIALFAILTGCGGDGGNDNQTGVRDNNGQSAIVVSPQLSDLPIENTPSNLTVMSRLVRLDDSSTLEEVRAVYSVTLTELDANLITIDPATGQPDYASVELYKFFTDANSNSYGEPIQSWVAVGRPKSVAIDSSGDLSYTFQTIPMNSAMGNYVVGVVTSNPNVMTIPPNCSRQGTAIEIVQDGQSNTVPSSKYLDCTYETDTTYVVEHNSVVDSTVAMVNIALDQLKGYGFSGSIPKFYVYSESAKSEFLTGPNIITLNSDGLIQPTVSHELFHMRDYAHVRTNWVEPDWFIESLAALFEVRETSALFPVADSQPGTSAGALAAKRLIVDSIFEEGPIVNGRLTTTLAYANWSFFGKAIKCLGGGVSTAELIRNVRGAGDNVKQNFIDYLDSANLGDCRFEKIASEFVKEVHPNFETSFIAPSKSCISDGKSTYTFNTQSNEVIDAGRIIASTARISISSIISSIEKINLKFTKGLVVYNPDNEETYTFTSDDAPHTLYSRSSMSGDPLPIIPKLYLVNNTINPSPVGNLEIELICSQEPEPEPEPVNPVTLPSGTAVEDLPLTLQAGLQGCTAGINDPEGGSTTYCSNHYLIVNSPFPDGSSYSTFDCSNGRDVPPNEGSIIGTVDWPDTPGKVTNYYAKLQTPVCGLQNSMVPGRAATCQSGPSKCEYNGFQTICGINPC